MPSCLADYLLCLWGVWCLSSARATVITRMVGFSLSPRIPWVTGSPTIGGGWGWGNQSCADAATVLCSRFVGSATADEGRGSEGQGRGHLSDWWDGVPSPTATAAQLVLAMGTPAIRRLESRAPTLLLPLGSLKLQAQLHVSEGQDFRHQSALLSILPPLCVPVHPPLEV